MIFPVALSSLHTLLKQFTYRNTRGRLCYFKLKVTRNTNTTRKRKKQEKEGAADGDTSKVNVKTRKRNSFFMLTLT